MNARQVLVVLATGRSRQALKLADLSGALVSSFGLVLLELGGLAALRNWLIASFGFTWGI